MVGVLGELDESVKEILKSEMSEKRARIGRGEVIESERKVRVRGTCDESARRARGDSEERSETCAM